MFLDAAFFIDFNLRLNVGWKWKSGPESPSWKIGIRRFLDQRTSL